jgi:hypothetical protein
MNEFARLHSGDTLFRNIMIGVYTCGALFAAYMLTYQV